MQKKYRAILAIDFDGVIHDYENPVPGKRMGKPMYGADLDFLREEGYKIIVHTANNVEIVRGWLEYYDQPYDDVTNKKPVADIYIDDKAYLFTSWKSLVQDLDARYGDDSTLED